jgi:hypothetical protein
MPTPPALRLDGGSPIAGRDRIFLGGLSCVALWVGVRGILKMGFVGQDFVYHRALILLFHYEPLARSYKYTNPPALYWFGSMVHDHVSASQYLAVMAMAFLILNVAALWLVYGFLWKSIVNPQLRYCAASFATLVPFRVVHSVVIASDAFTIPIFALAALFTLRLFANPRSVLSWAALSLSLTAGMFCKYTFAGLLAPVALLVGWSLAFRLARGERLRWGLIGALSLALPIEVLLLEVHESAEQGGMLTDHGWIRKGDPPVMRWRDILLLKASDLNLLSAPDYFGGRVFENRKYSYLGLLHASSVTDISNFFQPPSPAAVAGLGDFWRPPIPRGRTALSQALQVFSVRWCVVFSALALGGTLFCGALSGASLLARKPLVADSIVVVTALAVGFYLPVFLALPRVQDAYTGGYWTPRLVMPAVLVFFSLGFVLLDFALGRLQGSHPAPRVFLALFSCYTAVACAAFVGFLA